MIKGFTFVEFPVKNFEKSIVFYRDTLGLQLSHMDEVRRWCLFKIPGSDTGCALYQSTEGFINGDPQHLVHVVVQVEDVEKTIEALSTQGIKVEPIRVHEDEHFRISGFTDPEGHVWRVWAPFADA
ncbi:VOC family protein [Alicyclobacillus fastidiosus]|uniref:VOC family protein n=1 Tax=Alicyclobacillus fastidiosus TaxID=392011 RepID=A0ABV5ALI9_9BACL|nr:VOC family protein [Alicyclobacillus fastidiosus]WEH10598.1 VOC family protein [Alicyclobacillus fastidiosus]